MVSEVLCAASMKVWLVQIDERVDKISLLVIRQLSGKSRR